MIHLIYTSIPLNQIHPEHRRRLEDAINHWGNNHSFYENETQPNFQIRKVKDAKGNERLEWRRIFNRVLHIPDVFGECDLNYHGFTLWFKYVESIAVGTDAQFRRGAIRRFSEHSEKTKSWISERKDAEGLNLLELRFKNPHEAGDQFVNEIRWLQGHAVFFLETAAIYHLARQALLLSSSDTRNPAVMAMCKKLERIERICTLEDVWNHGKEQE